jgi:hypothetical protein
MGMSTISRYNCKNLMGISMISKFYYENDTGYLSPIHLEQNSTYFKEFQVKFVPDKQIEIIDKYVLFCSKCMGDK